MIGALPTAHFGVGVLCGLAAGGRVGIGHLSLFEAGRCFGGRGCFGAAGGFGSLGGGDASGLLCLVERLLVGVLGFSCLIRHGDFLRLTDGPFSKSCCILCACLRPEFLFAGLLGGAMTKLCTVFAT